MGEQEAFPFGNIRFETSLDIREMSRRQLYTQILCLEDKLVWEGGSGSKHFPAGMEPAALGELTQWVGG